MRATSLEPAMTPSPDTGRHPDGSIDFDFYRRAAARERHTALRHIGRRCTAAISRLGATIARRWARMLVSPRPLPR